MSDREDLDKASRILLGAVPFPVLTGAGVSVDSGIPTFRGPQGIWSKYDPYEYGHIDTFKVRPERTWELLMEIIRGSVNASPNESHTILAEMEKDGFVSSVITQNVDGLHGMAGSKKVLELHGNARRIRCLKCGNLETVDRDAIETFQIHCFCGGMKKPEIVLYGEMLPMETLRMAQEICSGAKAVLVIGTSGIVYPAAGLPEIVHSFGGRVVEINPSDTALTNGSATVTIKMSAVDGLKAISSRIRELKGN